MGDDAGALSDGILLQGHGRKDRRSQGRLEGQRYLRDLCRQLERAYRRRQGADAESRALPAAPRSAGEIETCFNPPLEGGSKSYPSVSEKKISGRGVEARTPPRTATRFDPPSRGGWRSAFRRRFALWFGG